MELVEELLHAVFRVACDGRAALQAPRRLLEHWDRQDVVAHGVIVGGGVVILALFLWAHLGLGALLVPPATIAREQVASAGPYHLRMAFDADVITVGREHTATITLRNNLGRTVGDASVRVQPVMLSMPMSVPPAEVDALGGGQYRVRPIFSMAGSWRLDVTITQPGQTDQHVSFLVSVRWR